LEEALEMEERMSVRDVPWMPPVQVRLQNGLQRTFTSVYEALDFLESEWPLKRGERHDRAVSLCNRALKTMTPPAMAREEFIAACLEAGMPIVGDDQRRDGLRRAAINGLSMG
jgi:hypothetical protein